MPFGKFHGHRLDEIAAFEPSYIDWLARAVQRDPDLTMAARVMQDDLDQRGIVRRTHHIQRPGGRSGATTPDRKCEIALRYRRAIEARMKSVSVLPPRRSTRPVGRRNQLLGS